MPPNITLLKNMEKLAEHKDELARARAKAADQALMRGMNADEVHNMDMEEEVEIDSDDEEAAELRAMEASAAETGRALEGGAASHGKLDKALKAKKLTAHTKVREAEEEIYDHHHASCEGWGEGCRENVLF
jgi:hypothetical protein